MSTKKVDLESDFDRDMHYVYLVEGGFKGVAGKSVRQITIDLSEFPNSSDLKSDLVLDIDDQSKLIGIEIIKGNLIRD